MKITQSLRVLFKYIVLQIFSMAQCKGITKNGAPCAKRSVEGRDYCYLHIDGFLNKISYGLCELFGVKRRFLIWAIIFAVVLFVVATSVAYKIDKILTEVEKHSDVYAFMVPFVQREPWGDYLPVVVLNTGDLPLYNVSVGIQTGVMKNIRGDNFEYHFIPVLLPYNQYIIKFGNKDTIKDFERVWCTPSSDYPYPSIFVPLNLSSNQSIASNTTTCGYCEYTVEIYYEKINKTVYDKYRCPIDMTITVTK